MNNLLCCIGVLLAVVYMTNATATPNFTKKFVAAVGKCQKETGVDDKVIQSFKSTRDVPDQKDEKCMYTCMVKEMGYYKDGKIDEEAIKADHKEKYDGEEMIKKANSVYEFCIKSVTKDEKDDCQYGYEMLKCTVDKSKEVGLVPPKLPKE